MFTVTFALAICLKILYPEEIDGYREKETDRERAHSVKRVCKSIYDIKNERNLKIYS